MVSLCRSPSSDSSLVGCGEDTLALLWRGGRTRRPSHLETLPTTAFMLYCNRSSFKMFKDSKGKGMNQSRLGSIGVMENDVRVRVSCQWVAGQRG